MSSKRFGWQERPESFSMSSRRCGSLVGAVPVGTLDALGEFAEWIRSNNYSSLSRPGLFRKKAGRVFFINNAAPC
jgi:hypothetical protein